MRCWCLLHQAVSSVHSAKRVQPSQPVHLFHPSHSAHTPYIRQTRSAGQCTWPVHRLKATAQACSPQVGNTAFGNALCGRPLAGILLWMVAAGSYPDYDSYTCRIPGTGEPGGPRREDRDAVQLVLHIAERFLALNENSTPPLAAL